MPCNTTFGMRLFSLIVTGAFMTACAEPLPETQGEEGSDTSAYGGTGFFRRAVIFATSTPEDSSTRCWYGSVVGSYRSRDFALSQAKSLNPFALPDRSLADGARALQLEANFRQVSSAAFCITAVASSMGLAGPICLVGIANSWQAWGELDAVNASQGNLNGAAAKSMTDWPYDQVVGLQKVVQNASATVTSGQRCPNNPPPGAVRQVVAPASSPSLQVCSLYRVKPGTTASMWTGPSGSTKRAYGVGGQARIQLAQEKAEAQGKNRIWGKVLDGTQSGEAAWFNANELNCAD